MSAFAAPLGVLVIAGAIALALGDGAARKTVMVCATTVAAAWIVARIGTGMGDLSSLVSREGMGEYVSPLLKGVGITWATALTSLALGQLGEAAAAHTAELVGAAELCVIALPLASKLVTCALALV